MNDAEPCTLLEWDTTFFKFRIARVRGDTLTANDARWIDTWCSQKKIDCLYFLARSDQPSVLRVAQMNAFDLVDIRVTFLLELSTPTPNAQRNSNVLVRPAKSADVPILQEIARHSHTDTRFYADERFPRHLCDALYTTWIARSCTGYADIVFAAEYAQTVAGYVSCHLDTKNGQGSIGLLGVDKQARGHRIGQALVGRALEWFAAQQMRTVAVATQGRNVAAQCLYQKNGFLTESVQLWYHKWYAEERTL